MILLFLIAAWRTAFVYSQNETSSWNPASLESPNAVVRGPWTLWNDVNQPHTLVRGPSNVTRSWSPTLVNRSLTFYGSCRMDVALSMNSDPKLRTDILRSIGKGLKEVGFTSDVGFNITHTMDSPETGGCESDLEGDGVACPARTADALIVMGTLRLDVSPITTAASQLRFTVHSDLTMISGAIIAAAKKVSGIYYSSVNLSYVSNATDRERIERDRIRSGSSETGIVPGLIGTLRTTDTGKLPLLKFEWQAPTSAPSIHNYEGQLYRVDTGTLEPWSGAGTPQSPFVDTAVIFSGNVYGLVSLRQYKFRVRAVNTAGPGHWSDWTSLIDPPRGFCFDAPKTPQNVGRRSDWPVAGFIMLGWDKLLTQDEAGGSDPTKVTYEVWGGDNSLERLAMADPSAPEHNQSVPVGLSWYFRVRSVGEGGRTSEFSTKFSLVSAAPPNRPKLIRVTSADPWEVVMFWETPDWSGAPVTGYEVSNDGFQNSIVALDYAATQYVFINENWNDAKTTAFQDLASNESASIGNASNTSNESNQTGLEPIESDAVSTSSIVSVDSGPSGPTIFSVRAVNAAGRGLASSSVATVLF